jgi:transposase
MPALCPAAVGSAERTRVFAGIDSHKDTLAVAVIDDCGRAVIVRQLPNDPAGFTALAALAAEHRVQRVGIEGSTNFGWAAAMHSIEAGVTVVEVPPLLTSRERLSRPG